MTKHIHDDALKLSLSIEDAKIEVIPKIIDKSGEMWEKNQPILDLRFHLGPTGVFA